MTTTELRTLALALQNRIADSYAALLPAYTEITGWTLNGADDALPTIAELKAVYLAFNEFEKPDYRLVEEVRALKVTTDEAVALVDQIAPFPHTHVKADVTDFPTAMPPSAHSHVKADVTDFPTTMPPSAHPHVKADVTDFPTTMPPSAHSHVKADVTDFPTTMPPSAHPHTVVAHVRYVGNGATSRVLTLTSAITPGAILLMSDSEGIAYYWTVSLGVYLGSKTALINNAISIAAGTVTLTSINGNANGVYYTLLAWGNAS